MSADSFVYWYSFYD